jgi:ketose-bisphosphate aldolase
MSYRDRLQCVFAHAEARGYAVPAFNYSDPWELRAIVRAAETERAPVLAAASVGAYRVLGIKVMAALGRVAMEQHMGVFSHLDHARRAEECIAAVDAGFASVMIDGSALPLDENIALTHQVVAYAHPRGVFVEGELGRIGGREDDIAVAAAALVRVEEVTRFVEETGVDALAIGIGNAHGFYRAEPQLDFDRLAEVRRVASVPLVLHGGTGIPDEDLRRVIQLGMRKVNIGTLLHYTYVQGLRAELKSNPSTKDLAGLLSVASEPIVAVLRPYLMICGASGQLPVFLEEVE